MNTLFIPFTNSITYDDPLSEVSNFLDSLERHHLKFIPWQSFPYKPSVSFSITYNNSCILLKYFVEEETVKAVHRNINDPVYKDSCVEFFIAFDETGYYNFEFNCLGTCLAAFGKNRDERKYLKEDILTKIKFQTSTGNEAPEEQEWDLTLVIPFEVFTFHPITSLEGMMCRANFYKCGDELPQPHFLCWNNIETEHPDFHRPEFFGSVTFNYNFQEFSSQKYQSEL